MLADIREQPAALRTLAREDASIEEAAAFVKQRAIRTIKLVGQGSSDNAASFGVYALRLSSGLTAVRDSLSLELYYGAIDNAPTSAVIAISQSGQTPDVVAYARSAAEHGTPVLAITNEPESPLAEAADITIPIQAGPERSLPATKTYTNQLASLYLLAAYLNGHRQEARRNLRLLADTIEKLVPTMETAICELASELSSVSRMFVLARGVELATACETALKLTESCRIVAAAMTTTAFCHGPVVAVDETVPVYVIASDQETLAAARDASLRVVRAGGRLIAVGSEAASLPGASWRLQGAPAPDVLLEPLVSMIPGQLASVAIARAKGIDPDVETEVFRKVTHVY
jgi:glucosamine--fructose-6-phosphate aminotransferase (isomerizing)